MDSTRVPANIRQPNERGKQMNRRLQHIAAAGLILAAFYLGPASQGRPSPSVQATAISAYAGGVSVATEDAETVFTASEDGKTIYMWQY